MSNTLEIIILQVQLPLDYGYVEFKTKVDTENAALNMNGVRSELCYNHYPIVSDL